MGDIKELVAAMRRKSLSASRIGVAHLVISVVLAEALAVRFRCRVNRGTYQEDFPRSAAVGRTAMAGAESVLIPATLQAVYLRKLPLRPRP